MLPQRNAVAGRRRRLPLRLSRVLVCALVVALAPPAFAARDAGRSSDYYEHALQLLQARDFRGALIEIKNALKEDPDNVPARLLLGDMFLGIGDGAAAEESIERARRAGADDALTVLPLARAYLLQNKNQEVLDSIRSGKRATDIEAGILSARGEAHLAMRQLDEAASAFVAAERMDPLDPQSTLGLARVAMLRGEMDRAMELADKAIDKGRDESETWYFRGEMFRTMGELDRALADFDKAVELRPSNVLALRARASIHLQRRDWEEAKQDVLQMRELTPNDPYTSYMLSQVLAAEGDEIGARQSLLDAENLFKSIAPDQLQGDARLLLAAGLVAYALGKDDDAIYFMNLYMKLNANHIGARKLYAQALIRKNAVARAVEVLRPVVLPSTEDTQLLSLYGTALVDIGRYDEGMSYLERAEQLRPQSTNARLRKVRAQFKAGDTEGAIAGLESLIELQPESPQPRYILVMQYMSTGVYDKAAEMARSLIDIKSDNPVAHDLLGQALVGLDRKAEAREAFKRALELDPTYLNANYNLGQIALDGGELDTAESYFSTVLASSDNEIRALKGMSQVYRARGNLTEAINWLERVRNVYPGDAANTAQLALLYIQADKKESAFFLAEKLYQENPTTPVAAEAYAKANQALGRMDKAVGLYRVMADLVRESAPQLEYVSTLQFAAGDASGGLATLERAVRTDPEYVPARLALVSRLAQSGDVDEALARLQLLEKDYPDLDTDRLRGDTLARAQRFAEAVEAYRRSLQRHPEDGHLVVSLYLSRKALGEADEAMAELYDWVKRHPQDTSARFAYASALLGKGRTEEAIAEHMALMEKRPDDPRLYNNLALLFHEKGDDRALEYARKAYELAPDPPHTKDTLGWLLVESGEVEEGLPYLREAHVRDSRNPEIRLHLGVALSRLGRVSEARQALEDLVRLSPDSDAAEQAREILRTMPEG